MRNCLKKKKRWSQIYRETKQKILAQNTCRERRAFETEAVSGVECALSCKHEMRKEPWVPLPQSLIMNLSGWVPWVHIAPSASGLSCIPSLLISSNIRVIYSFLELQILFSDLKISEAGEKKISREKTFLSGSSIFRNGRELFPGDLGIHNSTSVAMCLAARFGPHIRLLTNHRQQSLQWLGKGIIIQTLGQDIE